MRQASISGLCLVLFAASVSSVRAQDPAPAAATPAAPTPAAAAPISPPPPADSATAAPAPSTPLPDLSGEWCGTWSSCTNGHHGPLRANFCRLCDGNYQVTFVGHFFKLVPFRYTTTLTVTGQKDGKVLLSGSHTLGPIMGTFSYNAWATDRQFLSGYSSNKDQGQFSLAR